MSKKKKEEKAATQPEAVSEESSDNAQPQQNQVFQLVGQYVKDVSFECPQPAFLEGRVPDTSFQLEVGVQVGKVEGHDSLHEVQVILRGNAKDKEENVRYLGEVVTTGLYEIRNIDPQHFMPLLAVDGAALIYPLGRQAFIAGAANTGYPTPMIGAVDFRGMFLASQQEQAQQNKN